MPKLLTIQIPEPCGEHPDNMSPTAKGSYCHSCKKEVIDFTLMSDEAIAAFIQKQSGDLCGRFYPDQLNRDIPVKKKEKPWLRYFCTVALPAFLLSLKSSGQSTKGSASIVLSDSKFHTGRNMVIPAFPAFARGTLTDQTGNAVEAATVRILSSAHGAVTDQNGNFKIALEPGDAVIQITGLGLVSKEVSIENGKWTNISVERQIADPAKVTVITVGGMVSGYYRRPRPARDSSQKKAFRSESFNDINIFPNPVHSGSELQINWKIKIQNDQDAEVFSANGNLLQKQTIRIKRKTSGSSIILKAAIPGVYILMITDLRTGKKISKEFIVE